MKDQSITIGEDKNAITNKFQSAANDSVVVNPKPGNPYPYEVGTARAIAEIPGMLRHRFLTSKRSHLPYLVGEALWGKDIRLTGKEQSEIGKAAAESIDRNPRNYTPEGYTRKVHNECETVTGVIFRAKKAGGEPYGAVFTYAPDKRNPDISHVINFPVVLSSSYMYEDPKEGEMHKYNAGVLLDIANKYFKTDAHSQKELLGQKAAVAFPIPRNETFNIGNNCALQRIKYTPGQ